MGNGQFQHPTEVAADAEGAVYVVDRGNNRVQVFTSDGGYLRQWGSPGNGDGQFQIPADITVDRSGNVFVADLGNNRVQVFSRSGEFLRQWGGRGSGDGKLNGPNAIAVDKLGNVYVADGHFERAIQVFRPDGQFLRKWGPAGTGDGQFTDASGIAVNDEGYVYVSDALANRVQVFDSNGVFLTKWGSFGGAEGQFRGPIGIAVNDSGNIYVTDVGNHRVQAFSTATVPLQTPRPTPPPTATPMATPTPRPTPTPTPSPAVPPTPLSGTLTLDTDRGYLFSRQSLVSPLDGDLWVGDVSVEQQDGSSRRVVFFISRPSFGQRGLEDLGDLATTPLQEVDLADSRSPVNDAEARLNHVYVVRAREGQANAYIVLRVTRVDDRSVTFDWLYYSPTASPTPTPSPTPLPTPAPMAAPLPPGVHSSGTLDIPLGSIVDLDRGALNVGVDADIWFRAATEGLRHLLPMEGAKAAYMGGNQPGRDGCVTAELSAEEVLIKVPSPGFYVCVLTNEGRYSELQVFADADPKKINIRYTTWEAVASIPTPTPTGAPTAAPGSAAGQSTIAGTVLYNGNPITQVTDRTFDFFVFNTDPNISGYLRYEYDPTTGVYRVPDLEPGTYGVRAQMFNVNNQIGYFDGFLTVEVPPGVALVEADMDATQTIHLTSPVDTGTGLGHRFNEFTVQNTLRPEEVIFRWQAIPEVSWYELAIREHGTGGQIEILSATRITDTEFTPRTLQANAEGRYYVASLRGFNAAGQETAIARVLYTTSFSDLVFRVVTTTSTPTPTPTPAVRVATYRAGDGPSALAFDGSNIWVANEFGDSVTKLSASDGGTLGTFPVGDGPRALVFDGQSVWVANTNDGTLTRLSLDGTVTGTFLVGAGPLALAVEGEHIWVANNSEQTITRVRRTDGVVLRTLDVENPGPLVFDGDHIWVATLKAGRVTKIRVSDDAVLGEFTVAGDPRGLAFDGQHLWVTDFTGDGVTKLTLDGTIAGTFPVVEGPQALAFDGESIWVASSFSNFVTRLRAADGENLGIFGVGSRPAALAFDGQSIWVANFRDDTVTKIPWTAVPVVAE